MRPYPLQLEISGPTALWARPDTMPNPVLYVDAFQRRLEPGRWFYTLCLGSKELVSDYPDSESGFRHGAAPCATDNHVIPALLEMVFDQPTNRVNASLN